jgi:hypothetical protein
MEKPPQIVEILCACMHKMLCLEYYGHSEQRTFQTGAKAVT